MSSWLREKGADRDQVEAVLARLQELRLLDDERFALLYAEGKRDRSGWGSERIEEALLERGIDRSLANRAVAVDADEEVDRAASALEEKGFQLEDPSERQKALGFLGRRGYGAENSYEAIRRVRSSEERPKLGDNPGHSDLASGGSPRR